MGDLLRAVQNLNQAMAYGTAILARRTPPRRKLDAAEAGVALGTDDITHFHSRMMRRFHRERQPTDKKLLSFFPSNRVGDMLLNRH